MGLSQDERLEDAATNPVDSQRTYSAQASPADNRKKLTEVFHGVETSLPAGATGSEIRQVACDSRKVQPGALFFALHGAKAEGNAFIQDAIGWSDGGNSDVIYGGVDLTQQGFSPDAASRFPGSNAPRSAVSWFVGDLTGTNGSSLVLDAVNRSTNAPIGSVRFQTDRQLSSKLPNDHGN